MGVSLVQQHRFVDSLRRHKAIVSLPTTATSTMSGSNAPTTPASPKENVLVVLATGKMGKGVTDAFLATGRHNVYGTSRDANNSQLRARGVTPVGLKFGSKQSMLDALDASQADIVFLNTDFQFAAKNDGATELEHGRLMIDACVERKVRHVVHCSVFSADTAPLNEFSSKHKIEQYLAATSLTYTILRPGCFYDAFDDAKIRNPLTRGKLQYVFAPDVKIAHVATFDVGVAAAKVSAAGSGWAGKTLDCVEANRTMSECAAALSRASGVQCKYGLLLGMPLQWLLIRQTYYLSKYCNSGAAEIADTTPFRQLVGETAVQSPEMFFAKLGKWANGDKFGEAPKAQESSGCCS
jgi:uncharacterized protein YbjT (DUF2867 family)